MTLKSNNRKCHKNLELKNQQDQQWRNNIDLKNQQDPFVRHLICYLIQDQKKSSHRKSEMLIQDLRDNSKDIGLTTAIEIENFILDQIDSSDFEKIDQSSVDRIINEVQSRINESIEGAISRVAQLLEEENNPEFKEEFIDEPNKHIKDILRKIPVNVKWRLAETLPTSLFCDNAFTTPLDTTQEDDEKIFRNQFQFSRWKEIENENLLFDLMENDNLDQLIVDEHGNNIEDFIIDDLDQLVQKEVEAIQVELTKNTENESVKDISEAFTDEDEKEKIEDEQEYQEDFEIIKDDLTKIFYQFYLAIFYGQILKTKSLYSMSLLEKELDRRIIEIQNSSNSNVNILSLIKTTTAYKKQITKIWKLYNQQEEQS